MEDQALLDAVRAGFATVAVPEAVREEALTRFSRHLAQRPEDRAQLASLVQRGAFDELVDQFYRVLPFGTGGRRGRMGLGPNRLNPDAVASSVQGHVHWLRERFQGALSVVVAYDGRVFQDVGEVYDRSLPNPLLGVSSRDLAHLAARVYAANGLSVWLLPEDSERYLATPELSFLVRTLGAVGGLNLSASHNPPDDNGVKVYDHVGGQAVPPDDQTLVEEVERVEAIEVLSWEEACASGRLHWLTDAHHQAYLDAVLVSGRRSAVGPRVVFTALHGVGHFTVAEALEKAGVEVVREPEQCQVDGGFPTVPGGVANPEVPAALERAVALGEEVGAELVLGADPDADRIGCVVRTGAGWRFLNGNEIGTLVVHHGLAHARSERPIVLQTEVTSGFISRMARARGAQVVDHLLVGFKYIGAGLDALERTGHFASATGTLDDFVAGVEESHGVLTTAAMRDKDAATGALYLVEAAAEAAESGRTLVDVLEALWDTHGRVHNDLRSLVLAGAVGRARIQQIQASLRAQPPTVLAGLDITAMHDRQDPSGPLGPIVCDTDLAGRDVLVFELGDEARVVLRPSGTEPKTKVYVETRARPGEAAAEAGPRLAALATRLGDAMLATVLERVGLALPEGSSGKATVTV